MKQIDGKTGLGVILAVAGITAFLFAGQPGFGAEEETGVPGGWLVDMYHPDVPPDPDEVNTANLDPDNDGISNRWDNCPDTSNRNQSDKDRDGIGDACDDTDDVYEQRLHDYIVEQRQDACLQAAKRYPDDTDRDGVLDACDQLDDNGPCQQYLSDRGKPQFELEPTQAMFHDTNVCYSYTNACAIPSWMTETSIPCPRPDLSGFRYDPEGGH